LNDSLRALKLLWDDYCSRGGFDQFAEFTARLAAKRLGRTASSALTGNCKKRGRNRLSVALGITALLT
jgi:hypothetical protein